MELFSVNTFAKSSMIDALQTLIYHRIFFFVSDHEQRPLNFYPLGSHFVQLNY